jgi:hypothetical protein
MGIHTPNELHQVEEPFLRQLEWLGWRILRGDKYDPASTLRESFHEVIIEQELRAGLRQINHPGSQPRLNFSRRGPPGRAGGGVLGRRLYRFRQSSRP